MRTLMIVSFVVAGLLSVVPIEIQWRWYRPEFFALLVIYWSMYHPQRFGLSATWCVGLCQDLLVLSPMGFHIVGLLLIVYICHLVYQRLRNYTLWHQALWVFVLVGIFQLFANWLGGLMGKPMTAPIFLVGACLSALLWPLLVWLMEHIIVRFRLAR